MRLPILYQVLRHLLLVILCLSSLWMVTPCLDVSAKNSSVLCLDGDKHSKHNEDFSMKGLIEKAQTRAYLSPTVFLGTLRSILVQRDGTIRAWFAVVNALKMKSTKIKPKADVEVVYYRSGDEHCLLEVNQNNLKLGGQYLVFGELSSKHPWPSMTATALPIPNEKRTLRSVKRIICDGCAKPASISGLQNVRVQEGSKIQLHCHLAGNPIPWVEWYKNGIKVEGRGRIRVKTKRRTSRLVIRKSRTSDRGVFECRAGNVVSQDPVSASSTVVVTRKKTTKTTSKKPFSTTSTTTTTKQPTTTQSSPWTTEPCPTSDFCLNGGTCVFYRVVREYVCHCADGFIGLRCDYKDVSISVGEVRNLDQSHDRLFIAILVLFLIFFCVNWACVGICWLCCFRCQRNNWGKFRELPLLQKFLKGGKLSEDDKVSVDVAAELSESNSRWGDEKQNQNNGPKKTADDTSETSQLRENKISRNQTT